MRPTNPEIKTPEQIPSQLPAVTPNTSAQQAALSQTVTTDSNNSEQRPSVSSQTIVDLSSETCETIGEQIARIDALIAQYKNHTNIIHIKLPSFITNQFTAVAVAELGKINDVFTAMNGKGLCSALETAKKNLERTRQSLELRDIDSLTITAATLKRAIQKINFFKNKKHKRKLTICGVTVNDDLDLSDADYGDLSGDAITIENTVFNDTVNFSQCRLQNAKFPGCFFKKDIIVDGADIRGINTVDTTFAADFHSDTKTVLYRNKKTNPYALNSTIIAAAHSRTYCIARNKKEFISVCVLKTETQQPEREREQVNNNVCDLQITADNAQEIWNKIVAAHKKEVKKDIFRVFRGNIITELDNNKPTLPILDKINRLLLHVQKDPKSRSFKAIHAVIKNYVKHTDEAAVNTQQNGRETPVPASLDEQFDERQSPLTVRAATQQHAQTSQDDERQPLTTRVSFVSEASVVPTQRHYANIVTPTQNNNSGNAHALTFLTTVTTTPARVIPHAFSIPPIFTSSVPLSLIRLALSPVSENTYLSVHALASTVASIVPSTVANAFPETVPHHRPRALTQGVLEPVTSSSSPIPSHIAMIQEKTPVIIAFIQAEKFNDASDEIHALVNAMKTDDFLNEQIFFSSSIFANLRTVIKSEISKLLTVETENDARFAALCNFNQSELVRHIQRGAGGDVYHVGESVTRQLRERQNNIISGALPFTAALAHIIDGLFPGKEIKSGDLLILQKHINEKIRWVGEDFAQSSHVVVGKLDWAKNSKALTIPALQNILKTFFASQDAKSALAKALYDIFPTSDDPSVEFPLDFTREKFDKVNRAAYQAELMGDLIKQRFTPIWKTLCAHQSVKYASDDGIIQDGLTLKTYPPTGLANQSCNKRDLNEPDVDVNYSKYLCGCEIQSAIAELKTAAPHNIAQEFLKVRKLLAQASEKIKFETRGGPGTLFAWGHFVTELDNAFSAVTEAELAWREQVPVVLPEFQEITPETKTKKGAIVLSRFEQLEKLIAKQKTQYVRETVANSTNGNARASERENARTAIHAIFEPIFKYMHAKVATANRSLNSKVFGENADELFQEYKLHSLTAPLGETDAFKYQACYQLQQLQEEICGENGVLNRSAPDVDMMIHLIFIDVKEALEALKREMYSHWEALTQDTFSAALYTACQLFNKKLHQLFDNEKENDSRFSRLKKPSDLSSISDIPDDVSSTFFTSRESRASSLIPVTAASSSSSNDNATSVISPSHLFHLFGKTAGAPTQAEVNGNEIVRIVCEMLDALATESPIPARLLFELYPRIMFQPHIIHGDAKLNIKNKLQQIQATFPEKKNICDAFAIVIDKIPSRDKQQTKGDVSEQMKTICDAIYPNIDHFLTSLQCAIQTIRTNVLEFPAGFMPNAFSKKEDGAWIAEDLTTVVRYGHLYKTTYNVNGLTYARQLAQILQEVETQLKRTVISLSGSQKDDLETINTMELLFAKIMPALETMVADKPNLETAFHAQAITALTAIQKIKHQWECNLSLLSFAGVSLASTQQQAIKTQVAAIMQPIFDAQHTLLQKNYLCALSLGNVTYSTGPSGPLEHIKFSALAIFNITMDDAKTYDNVASALQKLLTAFAEWQSDVDFPQFKTAYASLKAIAASPLYQMPKVPAKEARRMAVTQ